MPSSVKPAVPSAGTPPAVASGVNSPASVGPQTASVPPPAVGLPSSTDTVQTVHSTTVVTSTATSTTTLFPTSTFVKPVVVTVVQNGTTSVGTPSLVTSIATSTATDGVLATATLVYANPTAGSGSQHTTLFQNAGAVAGIFAALGIVAALALLCGVYLIRRTRRNSRQSRWLDSIVSSSRRGSSAATPIDASGDSSFMRSMSSAATSEVSRSRRMSDVHESAPYFLPRIPISTEYEVDPRQFSEARTNRFNIRLNTASLPPVQQMPSKRSEDPPGSAHSSPSIYPVNLPHVDSGEESASTIVQPPKPYNFQRMPSAPPGVEQPVDAPPRPRSTFANRDVRQRASLYGPLMQRPHSAGAPPIPPKSALRPLLLQSGNHSPENLSSPSTPSVSTTTTAGSNALFLGSQPTLGRRTILNVRPRSAPQRTSTGMLTSTPNANVAPNHHHHV